MSNRFFEQALLEIGNLRGILETFPEEQVSVLVKMAGIMASAIRKGNVVFTCGNGGSAADAQHIAGELVGRFRRKKVKGYKAVALTTNSSIVTAVANDYSYDEIFSKQLESRGAKGDVLLCLSTSGSSPNIVKAVDEAGKIGMTSFSFVGNRKGGLIENSDLFISVPNNDFARIQEVHMLLGHILCGLVEEMVVCGEKI